MWLGGTAAITTSAPPTTEGVGARALLAEYQEAAATLVGRGTHVDDARLEADATGASLRLLAQQILFQSRTDNSETVRKWKKSFARENRYY